MLYFFTNMQRNLVHLHVYANQWKFVQREAWSCLLLAQEQTTNFKFSYDITNCKWQLLPCYWSLLPSILKIVTGLSQEGLNVVIRTNLTHNSVYVTHVYQYMWFWYSQFCKSLYKRKMQICPWALVWAFHITHLKII